MSLITRCPACETMFRVVPDQLRISEGWVRCGQCEHVFDASANLIGGEQGRDGAMDESPVPEPVWQRLEEPVAAEVSAQREPLQEPTVPPAMDAPDWSALSSGAKEPVLEEFRVPHDMDAQQWGLHVERESDVPYVPVEPVAVTPIEAPETSFMRAGQAKSKSDFWHRSRVRTALMLAGLLLCMGLLMQVLVHERDHIAAVAPGLKPLVEAICAPVQCSVSPLRQIDSVVIESSSFNKMRGDLYRLSFTLKNAAVIELAAPAIELSLTDLQDQPIMRRVFRPDEVGLVSGVMPAGAEASGALTLSLKTNGSADRIAGYRILAFYP